MLGLILLLCKMLYKLINKKTAETAGNIYHIITTQNNKNYEYIIFFFLAQNNFFKFFLKKETNTNKLRYVRNC